MGNKKDNTSIDIFANYSNGLKTNRDAWVYNASKSKLAQNVKSMIEFYNEEHERYQDSDKTIPIKDFVEYDATKIHWEGVLLEALTKDYIKYSTQNLVQSLYRPFFKQNCYFNKYINNSLYQMPQLFPEAGLDNLMIGVSGKGANSFSVMISDVLPDLEFVSKSQNFPLKLYEPVTDDEKGQGGLFASSGDVVTADSGNQYTVRDGITDEGLQHFTDYYQEQCSKEDVFYYIYGLLHSEEYRSRFANNLTKDLPHIPRVKNIADFWAFSTAGRALADLHLNYEDKDPYQVNYEQGNVAVGMLSGKDFYVEKMKFKSKEDKSSIIYNHNITINDIPLEAYEYVVNGKSAIEWVMDRQRITTHKDSQITNNPNDWANETMNNPRYPLDLLLRVITISLESVNIIKSLPKLDI